MDKVKWLYVTEVQEYFVVRIRVNNRSALKSEPDNSVLWIPLQLQGKGLSTTTRSARKMQ